MKFIFILMLVFYSFTALARQYIQCSVIGESSDVAVINLVKKDEGTLFLSSGMENSEEERILLDLQLEKVLEKKHIYKILNSEATGQITLPSEIIGNSANSFIMELSLGHYQLDYACFSRLYHDD